MSKLYVPGITAPVIQPATPVQSNTFRWATVVSLSPLVIVLDTDTVALPFTPDSLIPTSWMTVGDRVWCQITGKRVIIIGDPQTAGPSPALPTTPVPMCVLASSTVQTFATASWNALNWNSVAYNGYGMWSSALPNRIICTVAGVYSLTGQIGWTNATTGRRLCRYYLNGSAIGPWGVLLAGAGAAPIVACTPQLQSLAVGDYLWFVGYQESGANLNTNAGLTNTFAAVHWVSP